MPGQAPVQANIPQLELLSAPDWEDYELLDSGNGKKLERYGPYTFERPEHQAVWRPALPEKAWRAADAVFEPSGGESGGDWRMDAQPATVHMARVAGDGVVLEHQVATQQALEAAAVATTIHT